MTLTTCTNIHHVDASWHRLKLTGQTVETEEYEKRCQTASVSADFRERNDRKVAGAVVHFAAFNLNRVQSSFSVSKYDVQGV